MSRRIEPGTSCVAPTVTLTVGDMPYGIQREFSQRMVKSAARNKDHMNMARTGLARHAAIAIGFLAAMAMWSPSRAADPKPDAAIKNKLLEANVYLDDKIKADA